MSFHRASVLDPHLLEGSTPYDVVFCRNLLIYLESSARARVLALIERLLNVNGHLVIGHADRLDITGVESRFIAVEDPACFAYCRRSQADAMVSGPLHQVVPPRPTAALSAPAVASCHSPVVLPLATTAIANESDAPGETTIPSSLANEQSLLDQAAELANKGRFAEAIAACERHIRFKGFSPAAYYLMGMIYQAAGNRQRAEECFHKTVYLDPLHDEALLALALLAERRGDQEAALGFRRRAERSLTKSMKQVN